MKLYQKMLVASTAVGLISPLAAQASDKMNLEEMNNYSRSSSKVQRFDIKTFSNEISKDLIYLVPTGSKMQEAAKKLDMKIACEIFADRNYEDDGNLVSRKKPHALIINPDEAKKHVLNMVKNQALNCHSGRQIPCEIDSVCIHGDNSSSLATALSIRDNLLENGLKLTPLNKMEKFKND